MIFLLYLVMTKSQCFLTTKNEKANLKSNVRIVSAYVGIFKKRKPVR